MVVHHKSFEANLEIMCGVISKDSMERERCFATPDATLRQVFEYNGVDYTTGINVLNGVIVESKGLDKTFLEFDSGLKFYLINVQKGNETL